MAKRELQEINAGSMADIAFLLLIFFLVTTTMDKDTAFIRNIPKKIITNTPPPDVQKRDILAIKANDKNQLMVREEIFDDPNKISEFVLKFYRTNEIENDLSSEFPLYSTASLSMINEQIDKYDKDIEEADRVGASKEQIEFFQNSLNEWQKKKNALSLLGTNELREISGQAHIRIEVNIATEYEIFAKIQTEIEEALFELRDDRAKALWGVSYGVLKRKYALEKDKARDEKAKLDLLDILYPAKIVEVTPKK